MAKQKDDQVVIALFKDEDAAKAGEKSVKQWDKSDKDVKTGNMGIIYTKGDKVKTHIDHMYDVGGAFFKKDTGLTKDEIDKIGKALDGGQVAVVVTCTKDDVADVSKELTKAGGTVKTYAVKGGDMTAASDASGKPSGGSAASSSSSGSSS
jgi:hypothetical protein